MAEVHALKCDRCNKLEDLVEDAASIEFMGEEMVLGEVQQPPPGWYEVNQQPQQGHKADDHVARHFCCLDCLIAFYLDMPTEKAPGDDDIPPAFRRM